MKKRKTETVSLFEKIENFFSSKEYLFLGISLALALVFSLLYFDPDVSVGGDDSGYIYSAYKFLKGTEFPTWHGSFFSIILSLFIWIGGVNVVFLKFVSIIFSIASLYFIHKAFLKLGNYSITTVVVFLSAINFLLNKYASTTYSEPFFIFFQALYLWLFVKYILKETKVKIAWKNMLLFGVMSYLLMQTRTVAFAILGVTIIMLLLDKQYINSLLYVGATFIFHVLYGFYKKVVWDYNHTGFESQLGSLMQKNAYDASQGNEDFTGLLQRIWDNSELYLSKHLMKMTGFLPISENRINTIATLIIYVILILSAILAIKKNKKLLLIVLFLLSFIGTSFVTLQKMWDQERIIIIYFPYIALIFFTAIYFIFENQKLRKLQLVPILFASIMTISIFSQAIGQINKYNIPKKFTAGNFNTYNIDWQNYMLACKWAGENLSDSSVVICRKPNMAWIASGKRDFFKGLYNVPSYNIDTVNMYMSESDVTHIIMANLRVDTRKKTSKTVNAVRNTLLIYTASNPGRLKLLKEFGDDEKAYVFELTPPALSEDDRIPNYLNDIIVNPSNKYPYGALAKYYFRNSDYTKALGFYELMAQVHKDDPKIYFNIGVCAIYMEDYKKAESNLLKSIELDPQYLVAWHNLALTYIYAKDKVNATKIFNKLKELDTMENISSLRNTIEKM